MNYGDRGLLSGRRPDRVPALVNLDESGYGRLGTQAPEPCLVKVVCEVRQSAGSVRMRGNEYFLYSLPSAEARSQDDVTLRSLRVDLDDNSAVQFR